MRAVSAVPRLPYVPRHPRGESYAPWVLTWVGGTFCGTSAVVPVMDVGSHGCCARMVLRNVCRLVCGTTSKVQSMAPVVGAGASGSPGLTWIVTVPCHVPARNDCGVDGALGPAGAFPPPQADRPMRTTSADHARQVCHPMVSPMTVLMTPLPGYPLPHSVARGGTGLPHPHTHAPRPTP